MRLLTESFILDSSNKKLVEKRTDLLESLDNGKILYENQEIRVLGVYRVPISRPGEMNKNKRMYEVSTWEHPLSKGEGEGSLGLLDHPAPGQPPSIKDAFCVWKNHKIENIQGTPLVRGDMFLLDNANGRLVESIIDAGGKAELSTRGYGEIDEGGRVYNYNFKSTDCVYEGSYGVNFDKTTRYKEGNIPESVEKKEKTIEEGKNYNKKEIKNTNNKDSIEETSTDLTKQGDNLMLNKVLIREAVNRAFEKENKFDSYSELKTILEDIKNEKDLSDIAEDVKSKISTLGEALHTAYNKALTEAHDDTPEDDEYDGDSDDTGSAGKDKLTYPDPEQKISDSDEAIPDDVHDHEVDDDEDDTTQGERGAQTRVYKAGASEDAMDYEVMSGEVAHEGTEYAVYEDDEGSFIIENGQKVYVELEEDSDEAIPDDVHDHEIDDETDSTEDEERTAYTDIKAGSKGGVAKKEQAESVNLYKLNKAQLIDTVLSMDEAVKSLQEQIQTEEAVYNKLADYTLRLETYTLQAEKVLEEDLKEKYAAQNQVVESVEYVKQLKEALSEAQSTLEEQAEYIEKLEETVHEVEATTSAMNEVSPFVNSLIIDNPQLAAWEGELKEASSIDEARRLANKYAAMGSRIRLDRVPVGTEINESRGRITESDGYYARMKKRGMI